MIQESILELVKYGLTTGLVEKEDAVFTANSLLELFRLDDIEDSVFEKYVSQPSWTQQEAEERLEGILEDMMTYAYDNGLMENNSIVYKDLFDTKIMGLLVARPSQIRNKFNYLYEKEISFEGFEDVKAGIVKWPMSVIRISSSDKERLIELADRILLTWRGYSDQEAFILAETEGEPHNTITPIARKRGDDYELDLLTGRDLRSTETLASHADWVESFLPKYDTIDESNVTDIIREEIGLVFSEVLECAGVYKCTEEGRKYFQRFIDSVK